MTREQLEHLIRAAATIADDEEIVVIGSQAILGQFPNAPASMRVSTEADLYPRHFPERADLIDGSIGELSPFHTTYGYYAQGVSPTTAFLPDGWQDRLIVIQNDNTRQARGLCLEIHDLLAAKAAAGREKDIDFLKDAAKYQLASRDELLSRVKLLNADRELIQRAEALVRRAFPNT